MEKGSTILLVDDDKFVLEATSILLEDYGYSVVLCQYPEHAISLLKHNDIDVVISDINMPKMTGIELLEKISFYYEELPVILMTAYAEINTAIKAIRKGAFDFIIKPYQPEYLLVTLQKALKQKRLMEIEKKYKAELEKTVDEKTKDLKIALDTVQKLSIEVTERLTSVAEYRDTDTALHINRIGHYAKLISEALRMDKDFIESITFASPMHDIGKIGIPDSILLKRGPLTPEEFQIMKTHTTIGYNMLSGSSHRNIQMAAIIAATHHEQYNGTGYPKGLKGDEIPLAGKIVMICDQYDALRSKRPYKIGFTHNDSVEIIVKGDSRTKPDFFDPSVLNAFKDVVSEFEKIFEESCEEQQTLKRLAE